MRTVLAFLRFSFGNGPFRRALLDCKMEKRPKYDDRSVSAFMLTESTPRLGIYMADHEFTDIVRMNWRRVLDICYASSKIIFDNYLANRTSQLAYHYTRIGNLGQAVILVI